MLSNEEIMKKYPWTVSHDEYADPDDNKDWSWFECMPKGWAIAFRDMLVEEIDQAIREYNIEDFSILELKEKYGQLRIYYSGGNEVIGNIIDKYSVLSENICIICGKPDVPVCYTGWICPICHDCIKKQGTQKEIEEMKYRQGCMQNVLKYTRFSKDGDKNVEIDISGTANKIRENWNGKNKNNS